MEDTSLSQMKKVESIGFDEIYETKQFIRSTKKNNDLEDDILWGSLSRLSSIEDEPVSAPIIFNAPFSGVRKSAPVDAVSLTTNTIRKEVASCTALVQLCEKNKVHITSDVLSDFYCHLDNSINAILGALDILRGTILERVDAEAAAGSTVRPLQGALSLSERAALWSRVHTIAKVMQDSELDIARNQPPGEHVPKLVHLLFGFQFMLDIAAHADRQVPERLAKMSRRDLKRMQKRIHSKMAKLHSRSEAEQEVEVESEDTDSVQNSTLNFTVGSTLTSQISSDLDEDESFEAPGSLRWIQGPVKRKYCRRVGGVLQAPFLRRRASFSPFEGVFAERIQAALATGVETDTTGMSIDEALAQVGTFKTKKVVDEYTGREDMKVVLGNELVIDNVYMS